MADNFEAALRIQRSEIGAFADVCLESLENCSVHLESKFIKNSDIYPNPVGLRSKFELRLRNSLPFRLTGYSSLRALESFHDRTGGVGKNKWETKAIK